MKRWFTPLTSLICLLATAGAMAGEPFFLPLGFDVGPRGVSTTVGVSADGSVVVGLYRGPFSGNCSFRWTQAGGFTLIGSKPGVPWAGYPAMAHAVSGDGNVIVGALQSGKSFRWSETAGIETLAALPPYTTSTVYGVSHDGSVMVGSSSGHALRWDALTPTDLGGYAARGIAADGSRIIGYSVGGTPPLQGWMLEGDVRTSFGYAMPLFISADGSAVIGSAPQTIWRWTAPGGMVNLWPVPAGTEAKFQPTAVSGDGTVIVGSFGSQRMGRSIWSWSPSVIEEYVWVPEWPFIWDAEHGHRDLREVLVSECGLDLGDFQITSAEAISADGYTVAGVGKNTLGTEQAWVAHLMEPAALPLDINPGQCSNELNRKSRGALVIAVLGSSEFDVAGIDPGTVVLRGEGVDAALVPEKCSVADVGAPAESGANGCPAGPDGIADLVLKFRTPQIVDRLQLARFERGSTVSLTVNGMLPGTGGKPARPFFASDRVVLIH